MILTNHIQARMAQRGYDVNMLAYIITRGDVDRENNRILLNRSGKKSLKEEIGLRQQELINLTRLLAQAKKIRHMFNSLN